MSEESTPYVYLYDRGPLVEAGVHQLVHLAQQVAHWNRNQTWNRHITCVTHDIDVAARYLPTQPWVSVRRATAGNWGATWKIKDNVVIWINPRHTSEGEEITTLNHEVAHALTAGFHGWTWRRMHLMLMPLAFAIFDRDISSCHWPLFVRTVTHETVTQYRRKPYERDQELTNEAQVEIKRHSYAMDRCYNTFRKAVDRCVERCNCMNV